MQFFIFIHRWIGVVLCIFFCAWFISGIIMIYHPFPSSSEEQRLQKTESIATNDTLIPIQNFWPEEHSSFHKISLVSVLGEPYYWWFDNNSNRVTTVHAVTGKVAKFNEEQIAKIAHQYYPEKLLKNIQPDIEYDQWVVSNGYDPYRPFYRIDYDDKDKTSIYISSRNAQTLQQTTQSQRRWNYVGAIIHWIYPTVLRKHWAVWDQFVWWLALIGIVGAVTGIILGVVRAIKAKSALSNFEGWMYWHHISGLALGVVVLSWIFSGWLSMDHGRIFSKPNPSDTQLELFQNSANTKIFNNLPSIASIYRSTNAKEIEFRVLAGYPYIYTKSDTEGNQVWVVADNETGWQENSAGLPVQWIRKATQLAWPNIPIKNISLINEYDAYANLREGKLEESVIRIILDDAGKTWIHIDKLSGDIVSVMDSSRRVYRWLFNGLHSFDIPAITTRPILWYIIILTFLSLGALFSATGVVLGVRRLTK